MVSKPILKFAHSSIAPHFGRVSDFAWIQHVRFLQDLWNNLTESRFSSIHERNALKALKEARRSSGADSATIVMEYDCDREPRRYDCWLFPLLQELRMQLKGGTRLGMQHRVRPFWVTEVSSYPTRKESCLQHGQSQVYTYYISQLPPLASPRTLSCYYTCQADLRTYVFYTTVESHWLGSNYSRNLYWGQGRPQRKAIEVTRPLPSEPRGAYRRSSLFENLQSLSASSAGLENVLFEDNYVKSVLSSVREKRGIPTGSLPSRIYSRFSW